MPLFQVTSYGDYEARTDAHLRFVLADNLFDLHSHMLREASKTNPNAEHVEVVKNQLYKVSERSSGDHSSDHHLYTVSEVEFEKSIYCDAYQYVLRHRKSGEIFSMGHQDDEETPLEYGTLTGLINKATEVCDFSDSKHFFELLEEGGELADYEFVKEAVIDIPLSMEDLAVIVKAKVGDDD